MESLLNASQASSPSGATSSGTTGSGGTGYDPEEQRQMFMDMLTAQLENQNPMDPMKNKEMTSQLAQFSGVEQQIRTNDLLEKMTSNEQSGQRLDAVALLGKQAWLNEETVTSSVTGQAHDFRYQLDANRSVEARVTDANGKTVDRLDLGSQSAGTHQAAWDGQTESGQAAPPGSYRIQVVPKGEDNPDPLGTQTRATVQEVRFGDSGPELGVDGGRFIPFDRVAAVGA